MAQVPPQCSVFCRPLLALLQVRASQSRIAESFLSAPGALTHHRLRRGRRAVRP